MQEKDLFFVIPTYRLREVGETVEQYDDHFWRNGHSVPIVVFDMFKHGNIRSVVMGNKIGTLVSAEG